MKKILCLLGLFISIGSFAQSNGIDARNFISPQAGFRYDSAAVEDIVIRVKNDGPNIYFSTDSLFFDVSISTNDTSIFEKAVVAVGTNFGVGVFRDYTLISGFKFDPENDYTVCTTPTGSNFYPQNSVKDPTACVAFVVSLNEFQLKIEQVVFNNGQLFISSNLNEVAQISILDITGRLLSEVNRFVDPSTTIEFNPPANGFYFAQINTKSGKSATVKFIVNQ